MKKKTNKKKTSVKKPVKTPKVFKKVVKYRKWTPKDKYEINAFFFWVGTMCIIISSAMSDQYIAVIMGTALLVIFIALAILIKLATKETRWVEE